jgi:hypothetical protein
MDGWIDEWVPRSYPALSCRATSRPPGAEGGCGMCCRWVDDYPDSWEDEDNVSPSLVKAWEEEQAAAGAPLHSAGRPLELHINGRAAQHSTAQEATVAQPV